MLDLIQKRCKPCEAGVPPLTKEQSDKLLRLVPNWTIKNNRFLKRRFKFENFKEALGFVNKIGDIAEKEGHHPDIKFGWGYAEIELTTHFIGGLSENDFILAVKIENAR